MIKSFLTVGFFTALSRVFGYIRDVLMAAILGVSPIMDAFVIAFRLPNLFRRLFAEGAFAIAFVPLYSDLINKQSEKKHHLAANYFANQVLTFLSLFLFLLTLVAIFWMDGIMSFMAPGFEGDLKQKTVYYGQIMFCYLFFMGVSAHIGGMMNAHKHFLWPAFAPIILNIALIVALIFVLPDYQKPGIALSWTVAVAGLIQVLVLLWRAKAMGLPLGFSLGINDQIKTLMKRMGPALVAGGVQQLNLIVGGAIASQALGAVTYLHYADRLYQLPLGLIGVGLGVVMLPELSHHRAKGDDNALQLRLNQGLLLGFIFSFPAMAGLLALSPLITEVLFVHGAFTIDDGEKTSWGLMVLALGIPAAVAARVLLTPFHAKGDTKTPLYVTIATLLVNGITAFIMFHFWGYIGIAFANALASIFLAKVLAIILLKRGDWRITGEFLKRYFTVIFASLLMGGGIFALYFFIPIANSFLIKTITLTGLITIGLAIYGIILYKTQLLPTLKKKPSS